MKEFTFCQSCWLKVCKFIKNESSEKCFNGFQRQLFASVLWNRRFKKIYKSHQKTPVPESLLSKVTGLHPSTLFKNGLWHFSVYFLIFVRLPFYRTTPVHYFWDIAKNSKLSPFFILETTVFWRTHLSVCFERMLIEKLKCWNIFFTSLLWDSYNM